jgi:poly-gamma-glutamate capsule biosynthesis protein CapA/YwtB (metallophosphatase superfamily)
MRLALAGDTMLGRQVAARIDAGGWSLWSDEVVAAVAEADLAVCNLECCISDRGEPWPDPAKPFFFRAPPVAAELLAGLGIHAVTLANNHALDYGEAALRDTLAHLDAAGIAHVGAGATVAEARRSAVLDAAGLRVGLIGFADHPADFAATERRPGIAHADFTGGVPAWLTGTLAGCDADLVVATPHWGPNMTAEPVPHVRAAAPALGGAGAGLVAGHSAHCFHGVAWLGAALVCYDLGDFIDDYAVHPHRRNDLGLLWLVDADADGPRRLEAVPLALDYCYTRLAEGEEAGWIRRRFRAACAAFGVEAREEGGRLVVERG